MTNEQWEKLLAVIDGQPVNPIPVGFVIDSPWLPRWAGISIGEYFNNDKLWLDANLKAVQTFGDAIFLPGFWAEFAMCTEPSAFGCKCSWPNNDLPFPESIITDLKDASGIKKPNPKTDGLLSLVLDRLKATQDAIGRAGHSIKFAIARGPLNIASFLLGTTELMMGLRTDPEQTHILLTMVSDFLVDWLELQIDTFPSIDGIFILDDIIGFLGKDDFEKFALPYLKRIFQSFDVTVKFLHNDAQGLVCAPYLTQIGVNLFNFSFEHSIIEMKELAGNCVTLVGNIPPRDVLAAGTADQVSRAVKDTLASLSDKTRVILSAGGGMPPDVPTENINAFLAAVTS
jgi:uroporphyrinogen-III decarboxylase